MHWVICKLFYIYLCIYQIGFYGRAVYILFVSVDLVLFTLYSYTIVYIVKLCVIIVGSYHHRHRRRVDLSNGTSAKYTAAGWVCVLVKCQKINMNIEYTYIHTRTHNIMTSTRIYAFYLQCSHIFGHKLPLLLLKLLLLLLLLLLMMLISYHHSWLIRTWTDLSTYAFNSMLM